MLDSRFHGDAMVDSRWLRDDRTNPRHSRRRKLRGDASVIACREIVRAAGQQKEQGQGADHCCSSTGTGLFDG
jgi:hypothetical protein